MKKEYYEANKEAILAKQKLRYEKNKEKILLQHKLYRETHKEELLKKRKIYNAANAERFRDRRKAYRERIRGTNLARLMLRNARKRAKKKGVEFNLSVEDIVIPTTCPILGLEFVVGRKYACAASPTLDRIDPVKGYVVGNIQVISFKANMIKSDATAEEILTVGNYLKKLQNG